MSLCDSSSCPQTTIYSSTTVVTSALTAFTTTTSVPPYGTWSVATYGSCISSSGTQCLASTASAVTVIVDYFFGQNLTTTVTQAIPVTTVALFPVATSALPCSKGALEERKVEGRGNVEPFGKCSLGVPSRLATSKSPACRKDRVRP
ncbi:hypothetical protein FS842_006866 [Serendipita sp. 407]|nr:hypothetical protein FS842_006866 [Serendipita sp. 407]